MKHVSCSPEYLTNFADINMLQRR